MHKASSNIQCYWIESAGLCDSPPPDPLRGSLTADVVIVGGGYTGLATALYLTELFPERKVVLLEAGRVGCGASGRNDGLVLPLIHGAEAVIEDLIEKGRVEEAREVFEKTSAGVGLIERLIERHEIECEWEPRHCLVGAVTGRQVSHLEKEHALYKACGLDSLWLNGDELRRRVNVDGYKAATTVPMGGIINPAKLSGGLFRMLRARGVSVFEESRAIDIIPGTTITVRTQAGEVSAPALVLATNAYTSMLGFFRNRILPINCFNIATEQLSDKQLEVLNWDDRQPFYDNRNFFELFRLTADNRIVFSGGEVYYHYRNGLMDDESHSDYDRLRRAFIEKFPMLEDLAITHRWCGHVGFTLDRTPMVGVMGPSKNIYYGIGYSGHGVPVAFLAGKLISDLYTGNSIDPAYDFFLNHRPPAVPPEPIRWAGFALYKRYLHWRDSR